MGDVQPDMSDERDPELGAAIRSLPTPEHGPAFWDQLIERVAQEPVPLDLRRRRMGLLPRQARWLGAVAAVAAAVVAVASLTSPDGTTKVNIPPPAERPDGGATTGNSLAAAPAVPLPEAPIGDRWGHTAVWTGTQMLVWGGQGADDAAFSDGAAYDPATNQWSKLPPAPIPALLGHTAVWTGQKMLVWGLLAGRQDRGQAAGAAYDPATNLWTKLANAPITPRADHTAVWTGSRMIIWGGSGNGEAIFDDGAAYDPATGRWTRLPESPLAARMGHSAVWSGTQMLVWGGTLTESEGVAFADGAAYDPSTNQWAQLPAAPLTGRSMHAAVWAGGRMVIWGGSGPPAGPAADGAAYDPATGTWSTIAAFPLTPRLFQTALSTGDVMIVWGGSGGDPAVDGAVYDPQANRWTRLAEAAGIDPRPPQRGLDRVVHDRVGRQRPGPDDLRRRRRLHPLRPGLSSTEAWMPPGPASHMASAPASPAAEPSAATTSSTVAPGSTGSRYSNSTRPS